MKSQNKISLKNLEEASGSPKRKNRVPETNHSTSLCSRVLLGESHFLYCHVYKIKEKKIVFYFVGKRTFYYRTISTV